VSESWTPSTGFTVQCEELLITVPCWRFRHRQRSGGTGLAMQVVSSVVAPAARPKTEEYLRISHVGSLIAMKYYYFSHFHWLINCLSTAPVGPCRFPIYCVLSMYTLLLLFLFWTFFYFIFIFIILPSEMSNRVTPPRVA